MTNTIKPTSTAQTRTFEKLDKARKENADVDMKAIAKRIILQHRRTPVALNFWENMAPAGKGGGGQPGGALADMINMGFGSFEQFKKEFTIAAATALKVQDGQP